MILLLNNFVSFILIVYLNVITAVIIKAVKERLWMSFELFFLKTPNINKNIIDNDKNISGNTNCKFSIMFYLLV